MKRVGLIFILIILTLSAVVFGGCSSSTHISASPKSYTVPSVGKTDFTLTVKPTQNGTVNIGEDKTHAIFGEYIDIYIHADAGYEVAWVKINHGNRAEDKIAYFSQGIHEGVIRNLRVEYHMDIEALFVPEGSLEKVSHSYVGQPVKSTSVQTHFNIESVSCVNGSVTVAQTENVREGEKVQVIATPDAGYRLNEILVKYSDGYELIAVDSDGCFVMPKGNVSIMASFVEI